MAVSRAELDRLLVILRRSAREIVLPRFRNLSDGDVRTKSSALDLVTLADEESERFIAGEIGVMWPDALIVGEEGCAVCDEPRALMMAATRAVVIDPIDGTANFAAGVPLFGIMASVVEHGRVVAGVILDPMSMDAAVALAGEGAWVDRAGGRLRALRVAAAVPVEEMVGKAAWRYLPEPARLQAVSGLSRVAGVFDFRCAAHEYLLAVDGNCHFLMYTRSLPWDHLAGWLIFQEAGGFGACLDGEPYDPARPERGLLYAPDRACWERVRSALIGGGE